MNKYEWFFEFRAKLSSIGADDRQKAVDYYEELYADKQESGASEADILSEFGSPESAAKKILDEGVFGDIDEPVPAKDKQEDSEKTSGARNDDYVTPVIALLCTLGFFISGAVFGRWRTAWLAFLLIPLLGSIVKSAKKRRASYFAYPVFVTIVFLAMGMYFGIWHPTWIIFVTIPFFYTIFPNNGGSVKAKKNRDNKENRRPHTARTVAVVCGIIGIVAVFGVLGWAIAANHITGSVKFYALDKIDKTLTFSVEDESLNEIVIKTDVHSVIIEPCDGKDISFGYIDSDKYAFSGNFEGGKISFSVGPQPSFFDTTPAQERFVLVKVPLYIDYSPKILIETDTGAVKMSGGAEGKEKTTYEEVSIKGGTGSVGISDLSAKNVYVEISTGSVKLTDVSANEANVKTSTGSVTLDGVDASIVKARTSTGSIKAECTADSLILNATTGSVRFITNAGEIVAETSTGSVRGTVKGKKVDYNISVSRGTGSTNIDNQIVVGSGKKLEVVSSTGSVSIDFENE